MIIRYPTGLYTNVLPQQPQNSGNVTFTISNSPPPRTNLIFPKVPSGIVNRTINRSNQEVRSSVGDLVFTVIQSRRDLEGNNGKTFEIGQVLEFNDAPIKKLEPMFVGPKTVTQHNINRINYAELGIDDEGQKLIDNISMTTYKTLSDQLNFARQQRKNAEVLVSTNQKIINDSNRAINALKIIQINNVATDGQIDDLISKLEQRKSEAFIARDAASESANHFAIESTHILDQLKAISTVLK